MTNEAERIAKGDFDVRVTESGPQEIKELASNFNHMSERIHEMFEELKESERFKSELIANVSHDLRTPLSSIHSFVSALNDDIIEDKETRKHYYETILSETNRLSLLIEEVLELSQLENRKIPFEPVPTLVDRLVVETIPQFERVLEEKKMAIEVEYDDALPMMSLMPFHIKRVMTNLIQNAVEFSLENKTIRITVKKEEDYMYFAVKDEGKGIPIEEQSSIFQRFYRVEKSRHKSKGGSGLGLSICKEIIELHGGSIGVESNGLNGSTFWFKLPLKRESKEEIK